MRSGDTISAHFVPVWPPLNIAEKVAEKSQHRPLSRTKSRKCGVETRFFFFLWRILRPCDLHSAPLKVAKKPTPTTWNGIKVAKGAFLKEKPLSTPIQTPQQAGTKEKRNTNLRWWEKTWCPDQHAARGNGTMHFGAPHGLNSMWCFGLKKLQNAYFFGRGGGRGEKKMPFYEENSIPQNRKKPDGTLKVTVVTGCHDFPLGSMSPDCHTSISPFFLFLFLFFSFFFFLVQEKSKSPVGKSQNPQGPSGPAHADHGTRRATCWSGQ